MPVGTLFFLELQQLNCKTLLHFMFFVQLPLTVVPQRTLGKLELKLIQ